MILQIMKQKLNVIPKSAMKRYKRDIKIIAEIFQKMKKLKKEIMLTIKIKI